MIRWNTNKSLKKNKVGLRKNPGAIIKDETKITVFAEVSYCNFAHRLFQNEKQCHEFFRFQA
jgi:hypothetical protein